MSHLHLDLKVVCFGEILWDVLPEVVLPGGAPMNVAYHLKKLGHNPALITRIGHDDFGKRLVELMEKYRISTEYFQIDYRLQTGKVKANINGNETTYEIISPVAWDNINWDDSFNALLQDAQYFVFGSLCARNEQSRETLFQLLQTAKNKVLDINLRSPFFNKSILEHLLSRTDILKLNDAELELLTGWFSPFLLEEDRLRSLQNKFKIPIIVLTKGAEGAVLLHSDKIYKCQGFNVKVIDTIGSGDAFLAGFLSHLMKDYTPYEALLNANSMGALIATYQGACPSYESKEINQLVANVSI